MMLLSFSHVQMSNYAFKRIAEQALRPNRTIVPQPLNAALDVDGGLRGAKVCSNGSGSRASCNFGV